MSKRIPASISLIISMGFLLVGHGNSDAPAAGICSSRSDLRRAVVIRHPGVAQGNFKFADTIGFEDPGAITSVVEAVCALPEMSDQPYSCPAATGIRYTIRFFMTNGTRSEIDIRASGCQGVSGVGRHRTAAASSNFWSTLGSAMGLKNATIKTFQGTP